MHDSQFTTVVQTLRDEEARLQNTQQELATKLKQVGDDLKKVRRARKLLGEPAKDAGARQKTTAASPARKADGKTDEQS